MLIGFSGPSGSGKTTLVNMVAERLRDKGYDVGVVQEVAREVFRKYQKYGFPRGTIVHLIAVINGKIGVFRYKDEVVWCPVRLLHRVTT